MLRRNREKKFLAAALACFVAIGAGLKPAPTGQRLQFLSPRSQLLTHITPQQAKALLQWLNVVVPFMDAQDAWCAESENYNKAERSRKYIPAGYNPRLYDFGLTEYLYGFNVFGFSFLSALTITLERAVKADTPIPSEFEMEIPKKDVVRFHEMASPFVGTGVIQKLTLIPYSVPGTMMPNLQLEISLYDKKADQAFILRGKKAQALFNCFSTEQQQKLQRSGKPAIQIKDGKVTLFNLIGLFDVPDFNIGMAVTKVKINVPALFKFIEYGDRSLSKTLFEVLHWLRERQDYPQIRDPQDKVKPGPEFQAPGPLITPYLAAASASLSKFPPELLRQPLVFKQLVKIFSVASNAIAYNLPLRFKLEPGLDIWTNEQRDYALTLQQEVFSALQTASKTWFQDILTLLKTEDFDDAIEFLTTTGWIQKSVSEKLTQSSPTPGLGAKVKALLNQGIVVTEWTLAQTSAELEELKKVLQKPTFPLSFSLQTPEDRLKAFCLIKHKVFYRAASLENFYFSPLSFYFAYQSWEQFDAMAKSTPTWEELLKSLPKILALHEVTRRLKTLWYGVSARIEIGWREIKFAQVLADSILEYALPGKDLISWFAERKILKDGTYQYPEYSKLPQEWKETWQRNLQWVLHLMSSFVSWDILYHFLRLIDTHLLNYRFEVNKKQHKGPDEMQMFRAMQLFYEEQCDGYEGLKKAPAPPESEFPYPPGLRPDFFKADPLELYPTPAETSL